ncbi:MAG: HAMP domain-containing histidine kinase [Bryobacterales bacterium]|nr:HAMP domain-containing histidine kinase [Bryobacterales bacterium]
MDIAFEQTASPFAYAAIVHDLRNPLAAIHTSAETLIGLRLSHPQVHRLARNMYCASVRLAELLDEFLDQGREAGYETEPSDLRELVASAVDRVAASAELQSVRIVQLVPEGLFIAVDRRRIRRVLVNLLVNAVEALSNGGTIRISAVSDRRSVLIRVRDTGPGIPPEIRDRLFQPFATARKAGGVGLGLASSRQAVIDHGGQIWAESSRRGSCFAVRLPRVPPHRLICL